MSNVLGLLVVCDGLEGTWDCRELKQTLLLTQMNSHLLPGLGEGGMDVSERR